MTRAEAGSFSVDFYRMPGTLTHHHGDSAIQNTLPPSGLIRAKDALFRKDHANRIPSLACERSWNSSRPSRNRRPEQWRRGKPHETSIPLRITSTPQVLLGPEHQRRGSAPQRTFDKALTSPDRTVQDPARRSADRQVPWEQAAKRYAPSRSVH